MATGSSPGEGLAFLSSLPRLSMAGEDQKSPVSGYGRRPAEGREGAMLRTEGRWASSGEEPLRRVLG